MPTTRWPTRRPFSLQDPVPYPIPAVGLEPVPSSCLFVSFKTITVPDAFGGGTFEGIGSSNISQEDADAQAAAAAASTAYANAIPASGTCPLLPVYDYPRPDVSSGTADFSSNGSYRIIGTNSPLEYGADSLPAGLTVDPGSGIISGTMASSGTFPVTVFAVNQGGAGYGVLNVTGPTLPPPIFDSCGASNWPSSSQNVPYINSGDHVDDLTMIGGADHAIYASWYSPDPFVPFPYLSTDGTVMTATSPYAGVFIVPCTVTGDFTASFDILVINELSKEWGWLMFDEDINRYVSFDTGDYTSVLSMGCAWSANSTTSDNTLVSVTVSGPGRYPGEFKTFSIQRTGSVMSCYYAGALLFSYDFIETFGAKLAFYTFGDASYNIKNISVTQP